MTIEMDVANVVATMDRLAAEGEWFPPSEPATWIDEVRAQADLAHDLLGSGGDAAFRARIINAAAFAQMAVRWLDREKEAQR